MFETRGQPTLKAMNTAQIIKGNLENLHQRAETAARALGNQNARIEALEEKFKQLEIFPDEIRDMDIAHLRKVIYEEFRRMGASH